MTPVRHIFFAVFFLSCTLRLSAQIVPIEQSNIVGNGIAQFIPKGFDKTKTPSLILKEEPVPIATLPAHWDLKPEFTLVGGKACASLSIQGNVNLYGGGEVTGPLLRNGQRIKLWNTDSGAYGVDGGKRLYQSHPWVMGVREDGSAFGIIFDSSWKAELITNSDKIFYNSEGALFRIYIIDRQSPKEVLKGLAELTGTIQMPALWTLGYHQSRFSYGTEQKVRDIANTFRSKNLPCDVVWMDIDYMDGYRVFTFNNTNFSNPKALNEELHTKGFKAVYMIDPGVKVDNNYSVYNSGKTNDIWVKRPNGEEYHGKVWPGYCAFPDFTMPQARAWWSNLYQDFLAKEIDGVWNDMNEPAVNDDDIPESQRLGTMPYDTPHRGGGDLPTGSHLLYHNAYGRLMVEASFDGIMKAKPDKRPFLLTRANLLGGQRYAATWTGDNWASQDQMELSVPMSLTLGLSGQPFSGADIGGFLNNTTGDLWAQWLGFGVFMPFVRGHAAAGTNDKEPWSFGEAIEKSSRIALERRYRLLPYIYTTFRDAHKTGLPVMAPVFFDNPADTKLRKEQQAFLLGENLLVVPAFANKPTLPSGIWEELNLIAGDKTDKYQAALKIKGGTIIPVGKVVQNTTEKLFDPLTLFVCLNNDGKADGQLYWDAGDGWSFQSGDYALLTFHAQTEGTTVKVDMAIKEGSRDISSDIDLIEVKVLKNGKVYEGSGQLRDGTLYVYNVQKIDQAITFDKLSTKYEGAPDFLPGAISSSGLEITYSSSDANVATIVGDKIHIVGSGTCMIHADQSGNNNYNSADGVSQQLEVKNSNAEIKMVKVDGISVPVSENMHHILSCGSLARVTVDIETMTEALVDRGNSFQVDVVKAGRYSVPFIVSAAGQSLSKNYILTIDKRLSFNEIVKVKWNNTLMLNVNKLAAEGYTIQAYQWYKGGVPIQGATKDFYSAGNKATDKLSQADMYGIELTSATNEKIRTCDEYLALRSQEIMAYPNPANKGEIVYLSADIEDDMLDGAVIEIYTVLGNIISVVNVEGRTTKVSLPSNSGIYILKLKGKNGFTKSLKSIVK